MGWVQTRTRDAEKINVAIDLAPVLSLTSSSSLLPDTHSPHRLVQSFSLPLGLYLPTFPSCHSFGSILASAALTMRLSSSLALGLLLSGTLSQAAKIPFTQRKRPNHSLQKRSGKTSFRRPVLAAASSNSDSDGDLDLRYSPPSFSWTTPPDSFAIAHFTTCCILLT